MRNFPVFIVLCFIAACSTGDNTESKIAKIEMEPVVKRFDRVFSGATPEQLPGLKRAYPYLFPERFPDSVWINRMRDTLQRALAAEVGKRFPDFTREREELRSLFQHVKYYFPEFKAPEIVTVISDVDYANKVIYADSLLLISLDTYLGEDHYFYEGIQQYLKKNFTGAQIPVDAASEIARNRIAPPRNQTFLAQMVYYGKVLYMKDLWLPAATDAEKIGYTEEELRWTEANEGDIWRYFVERELLFATDTKLRERFINEAPFSKFYLGFDNESPGKTGRYIGWQIVRGYMENNTVSLQQLLNAPADKIFYESGFKPRR